MKKIITVLLFLPFLVKAQYDLKSELVSKSLLYMYEFLKTGGKDFRDKSEKAKNLYESLEKLSKSESEPDFGQSSQVMIPASCVDKEGGCDCFEDATQKLDNARRGLAHLRVINVNTKNYTNSSIAFGDGISGSVGVAAFEWQNQRKKILDSYANFKQICSNKHKELMQNVQDALMKMNECEAMMGGKDWYQKFGFIYYQFLYDKYQPLDI